MWATVIGTVVTGVFAQWNLGLGVAGPLGMLIAMAIVTAFYLPFALAVAELSARFPYAGGPYAYARRAFGTLGGYLAGAGLTLQFVSAAAAVMILIRTYLTVTAPHLPATLLTAGIFTLLMAVHVFGIREAAEVQVVATSCAISGILLFLLGSAEAVDSANILSEPVLPFGWKGVLSALPFAAWFFFGLGGVTVAAEETKNPDRNLPWGLLTGAFSVVLAGVAVWYFAVGSVPWRLLAAQDYPLLYVLNTVQSKDRVLQVTFSALGLIGFAASLLGLVNGYSRQVFALARAGYFPHFLSRLHPTRQTPYLAIVLPGLLALLGAYFWSLEILVALAVFSGMVVYLLVVLAFLKIRQSEPDLIHTSKTPGYPYLFGFAAILLAVALGAFIFFKLFEVWAVFVAWLATIAHYFVWVRLQIREEAPEESGADSMQKRINVEFH